MWKDWLRAAMAPTETFFKRGTEAHWVGNSDAQPPDQKRGRIVGMICSHSVYLMD